MIAPAHPPTPPAPHSSPVHGPSLSALLAPLEGHLGKTRHLSAHKLVYRNHLTDPQYLPRFRFLGPEGGDAYHRLGIFAGIHGDEVAGSLAAVRFLTDLAAQPNLARGYEIFLYPVCNPTGYLDGTRHNRAGLDLNREFWRSSDQLEVRLLENEIRLLHFDGYLSLHADDTSHGLYGFALGPMHAVHVLAPALRAASRILPRNRRRRIDNFPARNGIVRQRYAGMLGPAPGTRPKPFEVVLETPALAPIPAQVDASVVALHTILEQHRALLGFGGTL